MDQQILNEVLDIHTSKSYEYQVTPHADVPKWNTPIELEATFKTENSKEYAVRIFKDKAYGLHTRCVVVMLKKSTKWTQNVILDTGTAKKVIVTMMKVYHEFKTSTYGKMNSNSFVLFLQPGVAKYASVINAALERGFKTDPIAKLKLFAATDDGLKGDATGLFYINPTNKTYQYFDGKAYDSAWETSALSLSLKPAKEQVPASDVQHDKKALATQAVEEPIAATPEPQNTNVNDVYEKLLKASSSKMFLLRIESGGSILPAGTIVRGTVAQKMASGNLMFSTDQYQKPNDVPSNETTSFWIYPTTKLTLLKPSEYMQISIGYSDNFNAFKDSSAPVGSNEAEYNKLKDTGVNHIVFIRTDEVRYIGDDGIIGAGSRIKAEINKVIGDMVYVGVKGVRDQSFQVYSGEVLTFSPFDKFAVITSEEYLNGTSTPQIDVAPDDIIKVPAKKYSMGQMIQTSSSILKIVDAAYVDGSSMFKTIISMYPKLVNEDDYGHMVGQIWYIVRNVKTLSEDLYSQADIDKLVEDMGVWKLIDEISGVPEVPKPSIAFDILSSKDIGSEVFIKTTKPLNFISSKMSFEKDSCFKATVSDKDSNGVDLLITMAKDDSGLSSGLKVFYTIAPTNYNVLIITEDDFWTAGEDMSGGTQYIKMLTPSGSSALPQGSVAKVLGTANKPSDVPDNLNIPSSVVDNANYPALIVISAVEKKGVLVPASGQGTNFTYVKAAEAAPKLTPIKLKASYSEPATNDSEPVELYSDTFADLVSKQPTPPVIELFPGVQIKLAAYDFVTLGKTLKALKDGMGGSISREKLDSTLDRLNSAADSYGKAIHTMVVKKGKYVSSDTPYELREAISSYTGSAYDSINKTLRGISKEPSEYTKNNIKNIDEAFRRYGIKFPKDFVVYRGASISDSEINELQEGKSYEMSSYTSASLSPKIATSFAKFNPVSALNTMVSGELGATVDNTGAVESRQGNKIFMTISGLDQTLSLYIAKISNFETERELLINRGTFVKKTEDLVHIHTSKYNKVRCWYGKFRVVHTTNEGRVVDVLSILEQVDPEVSNLIQDMEKIALMQYFIQLQLNDLDADETTSVN